MPTSPIADIAAVRMRLMDGGADVSLFGYGVEDTVDLAIQRALEEYSRDRPKEFVADVTGNGTPYYSLTAGSPVLASWADEFSRITRIEYPAAAVSATHRPTFIDPHDYRVDYRTASGKYLYLLAHVPTASETVRITYTGLRVLTEASDTVLTSDKEALLDLATSVAVLILATQAPETVNGNQGVEFNAPEQDASSSLMEVSKMWRDRYLQHIGKGETVVRAAGTIRDWDLPPSRNAYPRGGRFGWLTHSGRR